MAKKADLSGYQSFEQITERLNSIVGEVRSKDVSLERSLDLFDEAIALGSKAVEMVDTTALSEDEKARLADVPADGGHSAASSGAAAASTDRDGA